MTKRMLVDATHPEETRVALVDGHRLEDLDYEVTSRKMLKGNIYLAKVIRIEPSLQAAFVEYGGNRHGFLAFSEIHPDYYRIPVGDRDPNEVDPEDHEAEDDDTVNALAVQAENAAYAVDMGAADTAPAATAPESAASVAIAESPAGSPWTAMPVSAPSAPSISASSGDVAGSGSLADLIPGFHAPTVNDSLITGFHPPEERMTAPIAPVDGDDRLVTPLDATAEPGYDVVGGEEADVASERFVRQRRQNYKIQEVIKRRQVMLVQVVKEERGNKGAALTTFLSLAGRYCVLMPNTESGGGVSRKITNQQDRRRMKEILDQLEVPDGMAVILRTAGMEQDVKDIQHDMEYLMRLWDNIREQTLQSTAPALIYEEANLIKRSLRDLYTQGLGEVLVAGQQGYELARESMRGLMPEAVDRVKLYNDNSIPLFFRYHVESQIDALHSPIVQLRSGGYLVINPTEALVAIDVNSGRATRERHIEETAFKTNMEAAEEVARQLRLRDLAGLIVIDFIDMEDGRNNAAVERRLKEAMRNDRARLQIGRISHFGLMELSRQRMRPSLLETSFEKCPHCAGLGYARVVESAALSALRALEEECIKNRAADYVINVPTKVALYILNQKRSVLESIEKRYNVGIHINNDDALLTSECKVERQKHRRDDRMAGPAVNADALMASSEEFPRPRFDLEADAGDDTDSGQSQPSHRRQDERSEERQGRGRNRRDGFRGQPSDAATAGERQDNGTNGHAEPFEEGDESGGLPHDQSQAANGSADDQSDDQRRRRRRGRRGGRRRGGRQDDNAQMNETAQDSKGAADQRQARPYRERTPKPVESLPFSVHEIDTTPREDRPTTTPAYEVVNQAPEKPKAGWWRRLTGQ